MSVVEQCPVCSQTVPEGKVRQITRTEPVPHTFQRTVCPIDDTLLRRNMPGMRWEEDAEETPPGVCPDCLSSVPPGAVVPIAAGFGGKLDKVFDTATCSACKADLERDRDSEVWRVR